MIFLGLEINNFPCIKYIRVSFWDFCPQIEVLEEEDVWRTKWNQIIKVAKVFDLLSWELWIEPKEWSLCTSSSTVFHGSIGVSQFPVQLNEQMIHSCPKAILLLSTINILRLLWNHRWDFYGKFSCRTMLNPEKQRSTLKSTSSSILQAWFDDWWLIMPITVFNSKK